MNLNFGAENSSIEVSGYEVSNIDFVKKSNTSYEVKVYIILDNQKELKVTIPECDFSKCVNIESTMNICNKVVNFTIVGQCRVQKDKSVFFVEKV